MYGCYHGFRAEEIRVLVPGTHVFLRNTCLSCRAHSFVVNWLARWITDKLLPLAGFLLYGTHNLQRSLLLLVVQKDSKMSCFHNNTMHWMSKGHSLRVGRSKKKKKQNLKIQEYFNNSLCSSTGGWKFTKLLNSNRTYETWKSITTFLFRLYLSNYIHNIIGHYNSSVRIAA